MAMKGDSSYAGDWSRAVHLKAGFGPGPGFTQMFMAALSIVLLPETGLNRWSVGSGAFLTLFAVTSRRLFMASPPGNSVCARK